MGASSKYNSYAMNLLSIFFSLRYVSIIAVVASFIGALIMFLFGALKIAGAVVLLVSGGNFASLMGGHVGNAGGSQVMLLVINSVDSFLFALVLLIFSYGIYELFVDRIKPDQENNYPTWIRIDSIEHLKGYLAQVIIIILFVQFLEIVLVNGEGVLVWEGVVLPVSILCLAGALYLMQKQERSSNHK